MHGGRTIQGKRERGNDKPRRIRERDDKRAVTLLIATARVAVGRQDARLGDKAEVVPVAVDHRKHPRLRLLERIEHAAHLLVGIDHVGRRDHVGVDLRIVLGRVEHIRPQVVELDDPQQHPVAAHHREDIATHRRDETHHVAQGRVHRHRVEIGLHQPLQVEEDQHRTVFVVREQLAALVEFFRIDRIGFEIVADTERNGRSEHQRNEKRVAVGQFGDQEDRRERSLHHAGHPAMPTSVNETIGTSKPK